MKSGTPLSYSEIFIYVKTSINWDSRKSHFGKLPKYYQGMLYKWGKFVIGKMHVFFSSFSNKGLNFVGQLFDRERKLKTCECLQDEFSLTNKKFKLF